MSEYRDLDNPLQMEIERRMQKNCDSGSFTIPRGLVDLAGSMGAVLEAVYKRADQIDVEFTIEVEKDRSFRSLENTYILRYATTTVSWSR